MKKYEKFILEQGTRLFINAALGEIEKRRKKLEAQGNTLIDILNTGLLFDLKKAQEKGLNFIENRLLERQKRGKKDKKT